MDWDAIGALSESVGAIAVIITLLYLAIQIRAQTKESRLTATRELARDYRDVIESITMDKEIFSRGCNVFCVTARVKYTPPSGLRTQS